MARRTTPLDPSSRRRSGVLVAAAVLVLLVVGAVVVVVTRSGDRSSDPPVSAPARPAPSGSPTPPPVLLAMAPCDAAQLLSSGVDDVPVTVTSAALTVAVDGDHPVCRVEGTIAPQIRFVVELPTTTYRQRYLQVGCGGLCGEVDSEVPQAAGCAPLTGGEFVTATNDLGHQGTDGLFGTDAQQRADFAYRADHLVAVVAKALIRQVYGQGPRWSYFTGCSQGGHEALTEVQRYPEDFDGVVAGAPATVTTELYSFYQSWLASVSLDPAGAPLFDPTSLGLLHQAVLDACDGIDGLADGQLEDPRDCDLDPGALQCPPGAVPAGCLTEQQVGAARRLYSGPVDAAGQLLYPGGAQRGSELEWIGWFVPTRPGEVTGAQSLAGPWLTHLVDPVAEGPNAAGVTFDEATLTRVQRLAGLYDAVDPDLSAFRDAGGKLLLYHGWNDPAISPLGTVAYHQAVLDAMGGAEGTDDFLRLYMIPGLGHCVDGQGPNVFDTLTPVLQWVEQSVPPGLIVGTDPATGRTRPVAPYPQVVRYAGRGSIDEAASFQVVPEAAESTEDAVDWLGSFGSDRELWWDGRQLTRDRPPGQ